MLSICSVKGCRCDKTDETIKLYRLPAISKKPVLMDLTTDRQDRWLLAINRPNLQPDSLRVCSQHFEFGMYFIFYYYTLQAELT